MSMLHLSGSPWLITEVALKNLIARRESFFADSAASAHRQAIASRSGAPLKNAQLAYTRGAVGVIPVIGPLVRHADMFTDFWNITTYGTISKDLQAALDSSEVDAIALDVDTPGGDANGVFELADMIYEARKIKPVRCYVGGMAASAGYAIGSACEDITIAASAELGSIGVRAGYLDDSKAMDAAGFKEWTFVSSQSPYKAFDVNDEDARARMQVVIDDLAGVFVELVARNRDVTTAAVLERFGKGDVMVGARAIAAGLADQLGSFESLISEMNQFTAGRSDAMRLAAMERRMSIKSTVQTEPKIVASVQTSKCDGCGSAMSGNCYCQSCVDDDGNDEDDDEDAVALGVAKTMTRADRRHRIAGLVASVAHVVELTGSKTEAEARGKMAAALTAVADLAALRTEMLAAQTVSMSAALRTNLVAAINGKTLNLGMIQKRLPAALRGETKKAWLTAMGGLKTVTPDSVIDAACTVAINAEDLEALVEFVKGSTAPVVAEAFDEPPRDAEAESAELEAGAALVKKHADAARKTLDRGLRPAAKK